MEIERLLKNDYTDYLKNEDNINIDINIPEKIEELNNIIILWCRRNRKIFKSIENYKKI